MLPIIPDDVVVVAVVVVIIDDVFADDAFVLVGAGDVCPESGDDGGDVFISSNGGDLLDDLLLGAPFNAELLANCKYADNFGNISLTSSISLL